MMKRIAFSYLIPVRNGMAFLPQLRNVVDKISFNTNDEIVIINDGSTDGTDKFLSQWCLSNPALKVLNNTSAGLVSALNLGISASSRDWIARFDVDDVYSLERLNVQADAIQNDVAAIFSDYCISTERGTRVSSIKTAISSEATRISLIHNRRTPHPGVVFNKEAVLSVGGYRLEDFPCEDLSLWLRLSKSHRITTVPQELLKYRINRGSISSTQRVRMLTKKFEILRKYPLTQVEVFNHVSKFQDYLDLIAFDPCVLNRVVNSLEDIQECSRLFGYEVPKGKEIIKETTLANNRSLKIEKCRNLVELIARNSYKRISNPF
jgi:glycosyltransferase involved in cell wall biosynthesis